MDNRQFIEQCIENKDVPSIIKRAQEVELYPIIIPSYKNRYSRLYDYFEKEKMKFYVFVYEDDFTASGYDKYDFKYGEIVRITPEDFARYGMEGKLLGKKRFYIQKYAEIHGIDKYLMIDDDFDPKNAGYFPNLVNGKAKAQVFEYKDFLKSLQFIFDSYNLVACSPIDRKCIWAYPYNVNDIIQRKSINGTFVINNKALIDAGIEWAKEPMFEDDDLCIKILLADLPYGKITCFGYNVDGDRSKTVIPYRDDLSHNLYKKYPWCTNVRLFWRKDSKEWALIKLFFASKAKKINNPYDKDKHDAACRLSTKEFMQWLADREGIDLTKSPEDQPKPLMENLF